MNASQTICDICVGVIANLSHSNQNRTCLLSYEDRNVAKVFKRDVYVISIIVHYTL